MLSTTPQRVCTFCALPESTLPEWAQELGALTEPQPGIFQCATALTPALPPLALLENEVRSQLDHELRLFAWLCDRAMPERCIAPLGSASEVVHTISQIDRWAIETGTVVYQLRHWPTGRTVISTYGAQRGHDAA